MEFYFHSKCLKILCDIEKLANKHNCIVQFGIDHHNIKEFNIEDCNDYTPAIGQELKERGYYEEACGEVMALWLKLIDNKIKHAQPEKRLVFANVYKRVQYGFNYEYAEATDNDLSVEAKHFLENNSEDIDSDDGFSIYTLYQPLQFTNIIGFKNEKCPNANCPQMALEVFSNLVCDYLGENKIN